MAHHPPPQPILLLLLTTPAKAGTWTCNIITGGPGWHTVHSSISTYEHLWGGGVNVIPQGHTWMAKCNGLMFAATNFYGHDLEDTRHLRNMALEDAYQIGDGDECAWSAGDQTVQLHYNFASREQWGDCGDAACKLKKC